MQPRFLHAFHAVLSLTLILVSSAAGQDQPGGKGTTYLDPSNAGPDYALQGEFQGAIQTADGDKQVGVQIIALGGGAFRLVAYQGGLPGDGWNGDRDKVHSAEGQREGDQVVFQDADKKIRVTVSKAGLKAVRAADDKPLGELKRVHRKSETLGKKPPEGAVVLFDGESADAFVRGKLLPGGLLAADCESKQKFGDHSLHLEFRTPFKPYDRGQARGNSGMYVQSRYEVQILDSFGLEGKNNECGGVYSIAAPEQNMCYPPLTWQTYDADFTAARYEDGKKVNGARLTLRHNGVVIHDDIELPHGTPGKAPEGPEPAGLYLQGHGNPVVFRNIWVVPK